MYATQHGLDTAVMQQVVSRAMTRYSEDVSRIERAIDIVFDNGVTDLGGDWWVVQGTEQYLFHGSDCPCEDNKYRGDAHTCKHQWATLLVQWTLRRQERLARRNEAA